MKWIINNVACNIETRVDWNHINVFIFVAAFAVPYDPNFSLLVASPKHDYKAIVYSVRTLHSFVNIRGDFFGFTFCGWSKRVGIKSDRTSHYHNDCYRNQSLNESKACTPPRFIATTYCHN